MPKFRVLRRVDAFVDYVAEIDAVSSDEATVLAERHEGQFQWKRGSIAHFDARLFVALDADGHEIESTQRGDF